MSWTASSSGSSGSARRADGPSPFAEGSSSRLASNVERTSSVVRRNSRRALPMERPTSGSRFGPTTSSATRKMTMSSAGPMLNMRSAGALGPEPRFYRPVRGYRRLRFGNGVSWAWRRSARSRVRSASRCISSSTGWTFSLKSETDSNSRLTWRTSPTSTTVSTAMEASPTVSHTTTGTDTPWRIPPDRARGLRLGGQFPQEPVVLEQEVHPDDVVDGERRRLRSLAAEGVGRVEPPEVLLRFLVRLVQPSVVVEVQLGLDAVHGVRDVDARRHQQRDDLAVGPLLHGAEALGAHEPVGPLAPPTTDRQEDRLGSHVHFTALRARGSDRGHFDASIGPRIGALDTVGRPLLGGSSGLRLVAVQGKGPRRDVPDLLPQRRRLQHGGLPAQSNHQLGHPGQVTGGQGHLDRPVLPLGGLLDVVVLGHPPGRWPKQEPDPDVLVGARVQRAAGPGQAPGLEVLAGLAHRLDAVGPEHALPVRLPVPRHHVPVPDGREHLFGLDLPNGGGVPGRRVVLDLQAAPVRGGPAERVQGLGALGGPGGAASIRGLHPP